MIALWQFIEPRLMALNLTASGEKNDNEMNIFRLFFNKLNGFFWDQNDDRKKKFLKIKFLSQYIKKKVRIHEYKLYNQ